MLLNARFLPQTHNISSYLFNEIYLKYKSQFESFFFFTGLYFALWNSSEGDHKWDSAWVILQTKDEVTSLTRLITVLWPLSFKERALSVPTAKATMSIQEVLLFQVQEMATPGKVRGATSRMTGFYLITVTCWACPYFPWFYRRVWFHRGKTTGQNFQISRNLPVIWRAERAAFSFWDGFQSLHSAL